MLRPGGFPEYTPLQQQLFDQISRIIEKNYQASGFSHIRTPAVERNDVLCKGGDEISKQVFGLYGLAQGGEDLKDYALHFDLTVPFARYVLDWQNELAFPFRRYQMQPVWRGERSQKGRFKEFWQADIDVIWKETGAVYDSFLATSEIIAPLASTLNELFIHFSLEGSLTVRVNNKKILAHLMDELFGKKGECSADQEEKKSKTLALFDKYHKMEQSAFFSLLGSVASESEIQHLKDLLADESALMAFAGVDSLLASLQNLALDKVNFVFDPFIVRGLDYYTGFVFETFVDGKIELGSVCSGGEYAHFTKLIDPKNIFSGVGGSIGLSRLFFVFCEEFGLEEKIAELVGDSYLVVNFPDTIQESLSLSQKLRQEGKIIEMYPFPDKLGKQFAYADKKGISQVIILGEGELADKKYKIKHMKTGEESSIAF